MKYDCRLNGDLNVVMKFKFKYSFFKYSQDLNGPYGVVILVQCWVVMIFPHSFYSILEAPGAR